MTHDMHYQIEQTREAATVYIAGGLAQRDVPALLALCDSLPATVRTLRLDLRALGCVSAQATAAVRQMLRHWDSTRHGEFRLTTSHLLATYRPTAPGEPAPMPVLSWGAMNEALAGTSL